MPGWGATRSAEGSACEAWGGWRYRHARLARLLTREGMMGGVADAYTAVLEQMRGQPPLVIVDRSALVLGLEHVLKPMEKQRASLLPVAFNRAY